MATVWTSLRVRAETAEAIRLLAEELARLHGIARGGLAPDDVNNAVSADRVLQRLLSHYADHLIRSRRLKKRKAAANASRRQAGRNAAATDGPPGAHNPAP